MKEIKKVTIDGEINMADIRAGLYPVACDDTSCHLQCTCPGDVNTVDQYVLARNYYQTHSQIWN
jgi:hypothetical protein